MLPHTMTFLHLVLVLCHLGMGSTDGKVVYENEVILKRVLKDYERLSRPAVSMNKVPVTGNAGLLSIDGLIEQDEHFSFTAWLVFVWQDQRLTWDTDGPPVIRTSIDINSDLLASPGDVVSEQSINNGSEYSSEVTPGINPEMHSEKTTTCKCSDMDNDLTKTNITSIRIDPSLIWLPDIRVTNAITGFESLQSSDFQGQAVVTPNGTVTWVVGDRFDVRCSVDTHKFPFDTQTCYAEYATDLILEGETSLTLLTSVVNKTAYRPNAEYTLQEASLTMKMMLGLPVIRFSITFSRRWLFHIFSSVLPVLTLSLLNTTVFLLPVESGERVSFSVALLLSYAIYIATITNSLPPNSTSVCLFSVYVASLIVLSAATTAANIAIMSLYNKAVLQRAQSNDNTNRMCSGRHQQEASIRAMHWKMHNSLVTPPQQNSGRDRGTVSCPDFHGQSCGHQENNVEVTAVTTDKTKEGTRMIPYPHSEQDPETPSTLKNMRQDRTQLVMRGQGCGTMKAKEERSEGFSAARVDKAVYCLMLSLTLFVHLLFMALLLS